MASYPIAVLKFSWADTPYTNDTPNNLTYSDVILNRLFFPSHSPGGGSPSTGSTAPSAPSICKVPRSFPGASLTA